MREKNKLNSREKIEQDILRVLIVLICSITIKGMYNESNNIDQNYILVPNFLIVSFLFCLIYGINAFTTGNVVQNWVNTRVFDALFIFIKTKKVISDDKAITLTTKLFGVVILIFAVILIISGIIYYNK